jgi:hypothetical protein
MIRNAPYAAFNSVPSIKVASSASAFELLTCFDTGQRCTRNPKERDLDHILLLLRGIEYYHAERCPPPEPRVSFRLFPSLSSPGRGFSFGLQAEEEAERVPHDAIISPSLCKPINLSLGLLCSMKGMIADDCQQRAKEAKALAIQTQDLWGRELLLKIADQWQLIAAHRAAKKPPALKLVPLDPYHE